MMNLVQAWAERYRDVQPEVMVEVAGGGSGVGIAAMNQRLTDIAAASRDMSAEERQQAAAAGLSPREFPVALDALAIYVHRSNPLESITMADLAEIYGEHGRITRWSVLAPHPACARDVIVRVGRQSSSGTYTYLRERVLGAAREFALGSIDQSGSKDIVSLVSITPCAIGYSGAAYATNRVKVLGVRRTRDAHPIWPDARSAADGSYPIARRLYLYTADAPHGAVAAFIGWVTSPAGQRLARELGFVPIDGSAS
jgi:phosphate transport system substrate-binding protein